MKEFSLNQFSLEKKVALVTGGASGLGKYYSLALSAAHASVFVVSKTTMGWDELHVKVEESNGKIAFFQQDLTAQNAAKNIVKACLEEFGKIDILVNNAGLQLRNDLVDYKDEDWQAVLNINLNALYYLSHETAKVMLKQQSGKIINIGSMQSYRAGKRIFPYTSSKHAVLGLTKAYADALAPENIQVNGIAPGYVDTPMTKKLQEDPVRNKEIIDHNSRWSVGST
ncbi:3-oxoacyl-[acyl-carrier protein] reductase [Ligilactobacillus acidipiscis DSM 15836]|uniref:3-oxoacyl-[acyl-carrier protein] reductase n=1 Tax=Ligilactobacillus acidipiscis DSM 15836 TaxID=1423716 RepID=A0ABR5PJ51_9LACO|nr:3-oxoacyl-[acyl-carrier protein] reductase [Ligilactobacillus acidipiscis DSM 15836]GAW65205.1 gluconate 5-dehydrogenase [Ligilactobacillus acidipiscis]GEN21430.1 2-deoxy-D-gluconate 3-dehydrogenase [Ligilactobacillus acidipiscis]